MQYLFGFPVVVNLGIATGLSILHYLSGWDIECPCRKNFNYRYVCTFFVCPCLFSFFAMWSVAIYNNRPGKNQGQDSQVQPKANQAEDKKSRDGETGNRAANQTVGVRNGISLLCFRNVKPEEYQKWSLFVLSCVVIPLLWPLQKMNDGQYYACMYTDWDGEWTGGLLDTPRKWCNPNTTVNSYPYTERELHDLMKETDKLYTLSQVRFFSPFYT